MLENNKQIVQKYVVGFQTSDEKKKAEQNSIILQRLDEEWREGK